MIALASLPPWNEGVHVGRPSDRIGGECRVRSVAGASRAASRAVAFANCGTLVPECCLHAFAQARRFARSNQKQKAGARRPPP